MRRDYKPERDRCSLRSKRGRKKEAVLEKRMRKIKPERDRRGERARRATRRANGADPSEFRPCESRRVWPPSELLPLYTDREQMSHEDIAAVTINPPGLRKAPMVREIQP